MVDVMCGPRAPVASAYRWCGWRVKTFDRLGTTFDQPVDLDSAEGRQSAEEAAWQCKALWWAQDCTTLTRAKDKPMQNIQVKSPPLRSDMHILGVPALSLPGRSRDAQRVAAANEQVAWGTALLSAVAVNSVSVGEENPRNAYLWSFQAQKELLDKPYYCHDWDYDACCLGGARCKRQRVRSNIEEISIRAARCAHVHSPTEWEWVQLDNGQWWAPHRDEAEYTAELAFHIAVSGSYRAARLGHAKIKIPRQPVIPSNAGDKVRWIEWPPEDLREGAMPLVGLRLGLSPPAKEFPGLPRLVCVKQVNEVLPGMLYVGQGSTRLKLPRSPLAWDFHVGQDGTAEESIQLYVAKMSEDPELSDQLDRVPAGVHTVIMDEEEGSPSYAEVIAVCLWRRARAAAGHPVTEVHHVRPVRLRPRRKGGPAHQSHEDGPGAPGCPEVGSHLGDEAAAHGHLV